MSEKEPFGGQSIHQPSRDEPLTAQELAQVILGIASKAYAESDRLETIGGSAGVIRTGLGDIVRLCREELNMYVRDAKEYRPYDSVRAENEAKP